MKAKFRPLYVMAIIIIIAVAALFNSYNTLQSLDEETHATWSEVLNQYQRRYDLVPNLVNTVKGYTAHEDQLLNEITAARAQVGALHLNAEQLTNSQKVEQFQQVQNQLGQSLSKLIAVSENYPDLKSSQLYENLMIQLEGSENRIAVARGRYIDAIQTYNSYIRRLPGNMIAHALSLAPKAQFTPTPLAEMTTAPQVNLGQ